MLCSLLPVKYASAKEIPRRSPRANRIGCRLPESRSPSFRPWPDLDNARLETKNSITSAGFFDDASKSMSPMTSLNRRKLPAALQRITSGCAAQIVQQRLGGAQRLAQQMFAGVIPPALDAFENVRLRLLAKPVQFRHLAGLAGRLQFFNRINAQLLVQRLDFLGPRPEISSIAIKPGGIEAFNSS